MFKLSLGYAEIAIDTNRNLAQEEIDFIIQWLRRLELGDVYEAAAQASPLSNYPKGENND